MTPARHAAENTPHVHQDATPTATAARPTAARRLLRMLAVPISVAAMLGCTFSDILPSGDPAPATVEEIVIPAADPVVYPSAEVTYLHNQTWKFDAANTGPTLITYDEQMWWHPDGTAVTKHCQRPEHPDMVRITNLDPETGPCREINRYGAGSFTTGLSEPVGTDPETVRRQLALYDAGTEDRHLVRAFAALRRYHHLNGKQSSAALTVLSDVTTLIYRGETIDRAGRAGMAVTTDSGDAETGTIQDQLIFDNATGALLEYDQVALTPPPGSPLKPRAVIEYVVYLDSGMVTTVPGNLRTTCNDAGCSRSADPSPATSSSGPATTPAATAPAMRAASRRRQRTFPARRSARHVGGRRQRSRPKNDRAHAHPATMASVASMFTPEQEH